MTLKNFIGRRLYPESKPGSQNSANQSLATNFFKAFNILFNIRFFFTIRMKLKQQEFKDTHQYRRLSNHIRFISIRKSDKANVIRIL